MELQRGKYKIGKGRRVILLQEEITLGNLLDEIRIEVQDQWRDYTILPSPSSTKAASGETPS